METPDPNSAPPSGDESAEGIAPTPAPDGDDLEEAAGINPDRPENPGASPGVA
jgi:hypothetical protein